MSACKICGKPAKKNKYCVNHINAYNLIKKKYIEWKKAYGNLSFREYLQKIIQLDSVGIWVKEVCQFLLNGEKNESLD